MASTMPLRELFQLLAILSLAACLLPSVVCLATVTPLSQAETWAEWEAHVARFHGGDKAFLASAERFAAFSEMLDFVRLQNARYDAGEATSRAALNYRSAYLPHERLKGHFQPEASGEAEESGAASQRRVTRERRSLDAGGCGPGQGSCSPGYCCSQWGYCGTTSDYCGYGCQTPYGFCWSPPPPARKSPPPPPSKHAFGLKPHQLSYSSATANSYVATKFKGASTSVSPVNPVDWRQVPNILNPVANQGQCGSCWAFAATAVIESINGINTGVLPLLSQQELMDCSTGPAKTGQACEGGMPDLAMDWVVNQNSGQATLSSYPYRAKDQACQGSGSFGATITGYGYVPPNSDTALMQAITSQPVVVYIEGDSMIFSSYTKGILNNAAQCGKNLNHAVVVVGYGYDTVTGLNYYIVRNSWGPNWGEKGYIRLAMMGNNSPGMCGMLQVSPVYPTLNAGSDPCASSPCGGGTCQASSGSPGGYICSGCPSGFSVQTNNDGAETCAADPCGSATGNPCGPGLCTHVSSEAFGYSCNCPSGTANGLNTDGSPTCVGGGKGGRIYTIQDGDTCFQLAINYHVSLDAFVNSLNPGINCLTLQIGQKVNVGTWTGNPGCTKWYSVQSGDTCYGLEQQFQISDATFQSLNAGTNCNDLQIGWALCMAGTPAPSTIQKCGKTYMVKSGDSCYSIWSAFGTSMNTFYAINPGIHCQGLQVGQTVCAKAATAYSAPTCSKTWTVQYGDNCWAIWTNFGISQATLLALNPGIICSDLQIGTSVCVG